MDVSRSHDIGKLFIRLSQAQLFIASLQGSVHARDASGKSTADHSRRREKHQKTYNTPREGLSPPAVHPTACQTLRSFYSKPSDTASSHVRSDFIWPLCLFIRIPEKLNTAWYRRLVRLDGTHVCPFLTSFPFLLNSSVEEAWKWYNKCSV